MAPSNSKELSPPIFSSVEDEMGQLISRHDWSNTPLGPIDTWSPTLELMVRILLANRFPMLLWWGSDYIQIYNDSYRPILGVKHHERALGIPVRECWDEIWHVLKPLIDRPFSGGAPTWMEDIELEINRFGFEEETHFTISYSAVPDSVAPGGIGGVLATVTEITEKVLAQRRLLALRDLGSNTVDLKSAEMACSKSAKILSKYTRDVPFSLFYLFDADKKTARLTDTTGIINSPAFVRKELNLADESSCPLPIQNVITTGALSTVTLKDHFENQPETLFGQPPKAAVIIPIQSGREAEMSGVVIAGVNPRIPYDNHYHDFFELIGDHVAASVNLARSYEAERRRAESLVELDKAKTDFFSNISHELRTPLTLMIGPLEDMLRESESVLSQKQAHDVELAYKNSLRLLKLVNSMLDFSRIEAGRANAVYERIDIVRLTYDLVTVFHSATDRAGLTLKVETGPDPIDAYVDREMWEKILLNLLSNAFKFTYSGGITVRLSSKNAQIKVEVEDTGTGISQENLPHIFERFYRVEGARGRTHEGTGIGLALVQELVKLHGGTITVESKIGQGTKFTIFIPAGKSHLPPTQIAPERTKSPSSRRAVAFVEEAKGWTAKKEGSLSLLKSEIEVKSDLKMLPDPQSTAGSRILLVDDNSDMRDYVAGLLSEYWSVEFAHDGFEALIKINRSKYDLIITDSMMPHLDGFGLIQELRKDPNTVGMPVIMLSARAGEEAKMEGLNAGADDYLVKPFSARELVGRVHAALKINKIRQEAKTEADRYRQEIYNFLMQIPSPIVVLMGPKYRFSLANPAYENMVGQKVLGKELLEAFKGPQIHEFVKLLDHVYKTGEPYFGQEIPVFLPGSDGDREERFINVTYHPYRDHTGEIKGILAVHQDVTDQKNIQDRLLHAKDDAERASQLKSAF
ncbi:MAG: ATP-binding protein, partial [Pseudobdellovibrio sp.]